MPKKPDINRLFADLVVEHEYALPDAVETVLDECRQDGARLGAILLTRGLITRVQADRVLVDIRRRLDAAGEGNWSPPPAAPDGRTGTPPAGSQTEVATVRPASARPPAEAPDEYDPYIDRIFAQIARERGAASEDDLMAARQEQDRLGRAGKYLPLPQVLIKTNQLAPTQFLDLLAELRRTLFVCTACEKKYRVKAARPGKRYLCKNCKRDLAPYTGTGSWSTSLDRQASGDETKEATTTRFGPYELVGEIGRGGMGIIYKAREQHPDRVVALKILREGERAGSDQMARFQREVEAAANLRHPNIVSIHNSGNVDGTPYYSMEYIEGGNLAAVLANEPIAVPTALQIVRKVAIALDYAHTRGIVHRDMKPANILFDRNDEPRIADFGLAKILEASDQITRSEQAVGTPAYMSPEQASGESRSLDRRSDVYSLGVVMYQALTGKLPFEARTTLELFHKILSQPPPPMRRLNSRIPRDVETICMTAMARNPADRYQTALALAEDIQSFLGGEPIGARRVSLLRRGWKKIAKHRRLAAALVAIVLATAGVYLYLYVQHHRGIARKSRFDAARAAALDRIEKLCRQGEEALESAHRSAALEKFRAALEVPDSQAIDGEEVRLLEPGWKVRSLHGLGKTFLQLGKLNEADRYLSAALQTNRDHVDSLIDSSRLAIKRGRLDVAQATLARANALDPSSAEIIELTGDVHQLAGRLEAAVSCYSRLLPGGRGTPSRSRSSIASPPRPALEIHLKRARSLMAWIRTRMYSRQGIADPFPLDPLEERPRPTGEVFDHLVVAERDLRAAGRTRLGPSAESLAMLAEISWLHGLPFTALEDCNDLLARYPTFIPGYVQRGIYRIALGDFGGALADLTSALRRLQMVGEGGRSLGIVQMYRGIGYLGLGDRSQSISDLQYAVAHTPDLALAHHYLAQHHHSGGEAQRARSAYTKALALDPTLVQARYFLVRLEREQGRRAAAGELLAARPASSLAPRLMRIEEAALELQAGKPAAAIRLLEPLAGGPAGQAFAPAVALTARALAAAGRSVAARRTFDRAIRAIENDRLTAGFLAHSNRLAAEGHSARAIGALDFAALRNPYSWRVPSRRGILQIVEARRISAGEKDLARSISNHPFGVEPLLVRGRDYYYVYLEDARQAFTDFERAGRLAPGDARIWKWIGRGLRAAQRLDEARKALERSLAGAARTFPDPGGFARHLQETEKDARILATQLMSTARKQAAMAVLSGYAQAREKAVRALAQRTVLQEKAKRLVKQGRHQEAIGLYKQVIDSWPDAPDVGRIYYKRAQASFKLGLQMMTRKQDLRFFRDALLDSSRTIEHDLRLSSKFFSRLSFLNRLDRIGMVDRAKVLSLIDEAVRLYPNESAAHILRGGVHFTYFWAYKNARSTAPGRRVPDLEKMRTEGIHSISTGLRINPRQLIGLIMRAYLHQVGGDRRAALADYERARALASDLPLVHYNLASFYGLVNRPRRAVYHLERALAGVMAELAGEPERRRKRKVRSRIEGIVKRIDEEACFDPIRGVESFRKCLASLRARASD